MMPERKFTPPTEFPAEYVTGNGDKVVLLGTGPNKEFLFIGYDADGEAETWTATGMYHINFPSRYDLHDIPKRITTWHNVYKTWIGPQCPTRSDADDTHHSIRYYVTEERLCVYRIERDEDGGNHEMFKEEV